MFSLVSFSFFLVFVLYLLNVTVSSKSSEKNKVHSFESGFVSVGKVQTSFSLHFFVIILLFVVFDVEVVLLVGLIISDVGSFLSFLFVFLFVFLGLYLEWCFGNLLWVY